MLDLDSFFEASERQVADTTRETYTYVLTRFGAACNPETCTTSDILKFFKATLWGASLRRTAAAAIRKYLKWRYGSAHPALTIRVKREPSKPGRVLNKKTAAKLLLSFDLSSRKGKRDYAIACIALDNGLRVNELATLKFADVSFADRNVLVKIKGGKWKKAIFSVHTSAAIMDWCNYRVQGDDRLFQVSRDGLRVIVRRWGEKIGIRLSPHDFRRSFATISTRNHAPSRMAQLVGRWDDLSMFEHYTESLELEAEDYDEFFPVTSIISS